ncbi:MAG: hypothetical protein ABSH42_01355 [Bryobacteraceae bacterium]|jgi:hypothetical protein
MVKLAGMLLALLILIIRVDKNWLEWLALIGVLLLARFRPSFGARQFRLAAAFGGRLARRRGLSLAAVGLTTVAIRLALLPLMPVPQPLIVDEYSHLLLADTLAHGRLANPPHPLWKYFETIHVIQQPTYSSMYFPVQGMFLAAGQLLGNPWFGVVASVGLMSAAILWMLEGWFPPRWALVGGVVCVVRYGMFTYWMNSYWGGAAGAIGGALVLGAVPRIQRAMRPRHFVALAIGLLILVNSRPFEGGALALPVAISLLNWLRQRRGAMLRAVLTKALPAFLLVLAAGGFLTTQYFRAVTGNPLMPPYRLNQRIYGWPLTLAWFSVTPVTHTWQPMHDYYLWEAEEHEKFQVRTHVMENGADAIVLWSFFVGPLLSVPLFFLPAVWRDRRRRLLVLTAGSMMVALAVEQSRYPHYAGPAACVALALVVASLRHMRAAGRHTGRRRALARLLVAAALVCPVALALMPVPAIVFGTKNPYSCWRCSVPGNLVRASVLNRFHSMPGLQLAIVRYGPKHNWMNEWVWNEADIDHAKVVWARDAGDGNQALLRYFGNRTVWIVEPDSTPPLVTRAVTAPPQ